MCSDSFKSAVSAQPGVVWYGMPKDTDLWQPVDAGYIHHLKVLVRQDFEAWLNDKPLTATDRRVHDDPLGWLCIQQVMVTSI